MMHAIANFARRIFASAPAYRSGGPASGGAATTGATSSSEFARLLRPPAADADPEGGWTSSVLAAPLPAPPPPPPAAVAAPLEQLWPMLVRRVGWEGDAAAGSIRLELGAGLLSGATILLRYDGGHVHVRLSEPPGADLGAWRARIASRLVAAGLAVEGVD